MKYFSFILPLIVFSSIVSAQEEESEMRWYTTEIIIFANTSTAGVQEEHWPDDPGIPDSANSVILVSDIDEDEILILGQPIEFQELPLDTLADPLATMQRSSRYRILLATAWRLPGLPKESAPPVLIKAGQRYLPDGTLAPPLPDVQTVEPGLTNAPANIEHEDTFSIETLYAEEDIKYELEGRIGISLSRYLDVDTDLLYRTYISLPDKNNVFVDQFQAFRLTEYRRMKSKTIHFLDHPMFGMIIAIDRYELPQLEEEPNAGQTPDGAVTNQAPSAVQ